MVNIKNHLPDTIDLPVNFLGGYMTLPKCEIKKMWNMLPGADTEVYIYLTLEPVPDSVATKKGETMISAVLAENKFNNLLDSNANKLTTSDESKGYFFDFINPCPPMCDQ